MEGCSSLWKCYSLFLLVTTFITLAQIKICHGEGVMDVTQFVVKREGKNTSDCEIACQKEVLLKCHYFLFLEDNKTCLLSATDHPDATNQAKDTGFDPAKIENFMKEKKKLVRSEIDEIHELKKKLNDLTSRVENFQNIKKQMGKLLMKVEMKQYEQGKENSAVSDTAIKRLNFKMVKIGQLASMLQAEISKMLHKRQSAAQELRSLRLRNRKSDTLLEQALNNIDRLEAYIGELKKEDNENKNDVEALRGKNEQIHEWVKKLKRKVDSTHSELRSNPVILKLLHNQKVLAETLDSMEGKLTTFDNKQIKSDETYDELRGRVIGDEAERRSLENSLISMKKTLKGLQDDFKRMQNPQSSSNMERLRTLTTLKNEVSLLKRSNEEVSKNLKLTRTDLMELVKDVVNTKLEGQSNRAGVTAVAMAHRHTQQVFDEMSKEQSNVLNKISVIEDVYRRILEVIHNLEVHQVKLKQEVSHFDESIHKMTRSFGRLVDDSKNKKLSDEATSLGVALGKLTSESLSGLKLEKLTPIKQLKSKTTETAQVPQAVQRILSQGTKSKQTSSDKTVASKPPSSYKTVASKTPSSDKTVASKPPSSDKTVASKPPSSYKTVASKPPNSYQTVASKPQSSYKTVAYKPPSSYKTVASKPTNSVKTTATKSSDKEETAATKSSDKEEIAENLKDKLKTLTHMKERVTGTRTPVTKKQISVPLKEKLGSVKKSFKDLLLPKNLKFTALKHKTAKEKTEKKPRLHTSEKLLKNDLNKRKDLLSKKVSEIESSLGDKKSPSNKKKFHAPKRLSTLPEKESTLPERLSTLPERLSTLPEKVSTLPEKVSTLPERLFTLPEEKSTLPEKKSTLPEKKSTLPKKSSPLQDKSSPLAKKKSSLQKKKAGKKLNKKRRKGKGKRKGKRRRRRRRKNKGGKKRQRSKKKRKPQGKKV